MAFKWEEHTLSYATGGGCDPIALNPRIAVDGKVVSWHDGNVSRVFDISKVKKDDFAEFRFVDTVGREIVLRPLDLAAYRSNVKKRLGSDARSFKTESELKEFFTKTIFEWPM